MDAIAKASVHGIIWTMLRVLGQAGIGFGVGIFLARTLAIDDFGLMAVAMSMIGLAELISTLGVEASLIQRTQVSQAHLNAAFSLSLLMATAILLTFWLTADHISVYFKQAELAAMLPVLGFGQWFSTITMVPRAILRRKFDFKALSQITLFSYIIGYALLSVIMALLGYGVWSIVIGTCANFILSSILIFIRAKTFLKPAWPTKEIKDLLHFGFLITMKYVINYVAVSSSSFIIGKLLNARHLGLYSRADQVANLPLQKIASTFSSVMFPIYAEVQHDLNRLANSYLKTVAAITLLTAPPLAVIAVTSDIVITGLYGEKWIDAAPILALLSIAGIFVCVFHLAGALVEATNRVWDEIKQQLVYLLILIVGFIFAAKINLLSVAWVFLLGVFYLYLAMGNLALKVIKKSWKTYMQAQLPGLVIAIVLALIIRVFLPILDKLSIHSSPLRLAAIIAISALLYVMALIVTPDAWLLGAKGMLRDKILRKGKST